jgi:hypothetical protein
MNDEPTEDEAKALAAFLGRAAVVAMREDDSAALRGWLAREIPAALPRFDADGPSEEARRAGANAKRCCGLVSSGLPPLSVEDMWGVLAPHLADDELRAPSIRRGGSRTRS